MLYILIISIIFIVIGIILFIIDAFLINDKKKKLVKREYKNFCIIIPARDESRVINNIINSIQKQTVKVDLKDIYVIVENNDDPTVNICKDNNINYFVRQKLDLKSKGYALMELIEDLYQKNILYDLYFIFDADNILDENFLYEMLNTYNSGYDVATGYRKSSNLNTNVISTSSALTFSLINDLLNENKISKNRAITISGTGYYLSSKIIDKFKSFPFHLMTEDYELSMFLAMNDYATTYNKRAIFYDEQPTKFRQSIKQRIRWCYGYLMVRRKYRKELKKHLSNKTALGEYIGIKPYVLMLISLLFYLIYIIMGLFINFNKYLYILLFVLLTIYSVLIIFTYVLLIIDKSLGINKVNKIKTLLYNPLFLITYLYCMLKAMFTKVSWDPIEHKGLQE